MACSTSAPSIKKRRARTVDDLVSVSSRGWWSFKAPNRFNARTTRPSSVEDIKDTAQAPKAPEAQTQDHHSPASSASSEATVETQEVRSATQHLDRPEPATLETTVPDSSSVEAHSEKPPAEMQDSNAPSVETPSIPETTEPTEPPEAPPQEAYEDLYSSLEEEGLMLPEQSTLWQKIKDFFREIFS